MGQNIPPPQTLFRACTYMAFGGAGAKYAPYILGRRPSTHRYTAIFL